MRGTELDGEKKELHEHKIERRKVNESTKTKVFTVEK
jgi:hypothetical protein